MVKEYKPETIPEFELEEENIPWLTEDKIDWVINIRWFDFWKQFVDYATITSSSDLTITCGFKPKLIQIQSMYPWVVDKEYTETSSAEIDEVRKTTWMYKSTTTFTEIGLWDSTTTRAVYLTDSWNEVEAYIESVSDTWFTLWNITYNWRTAWLHISILW